MPVPEETTRTPRTHVDERSLIHIQCCFYTFPFASLMLHVHVQSEKFSPYHHHGLETCTEGTCGRKWCTCEKEDSICTFPTCEDELKEKGPGCPCKVILQLYLIHPGGISSRKVAVPSLYPSCICTPLQSHLCT